MSHATLPPDPSPADLDDLSLANISRDRLDSRIEARRDADEFSRLVFGDTRTDEQLRLAFINGERTPEVRAGFDRFYEREAELMAKNAQPRKSIEEQEAEEEAESRRISARIRAALAADPDYQAILASVAGAQ